MTSLWPLTLLVAPLILTITRARSAWLWLSLALGFVALWATLFFVTWDWARGGTGWPIAELLAPTDPQRVYHDTYYVVAHLEYLGIFLLPSLVIGLLLWFTCHPRHAKWDVALFWSAALLFIAINVAPHLYMGSSGMPRRSIEYPADYETMNTINLVLAVPFLLTLVTAAARPIRSWWHARSSA